MKEADRRRVPDSDWLAFLEGRNPGYPETALRDDFATIRRKVEAMRTTRPRPTRAWLTTRWPTIRRPWRRSVRLMLGGLAPKHQGEVLHARVRYFDPVKRAPVCPTTSPPWSIRSRKARRRSSSSI